LRQVRVVIPLKNDQTSKIQIHKHQPPQQEHHWFRVFNVTCYYISQSQNKRNSTHFIFHTFLASV